MTTTAESHVRWNDLLRVTRAWRLELSFEQLLNSIIKEAVAFLGLERGALYLLDQNGVAVRAQWAETPAASRTLVRNSQRMAEKVVREGRPLYAHLLKGSGRARQQVISALCVPLTASRGTLGSLYVDSQTARHGLNDADQEFLELLGLQAAAAIEHAQLFQSAITDPLTGLFCHRHFQHEAEQAVRRAQRTGQPLSLIILDLDKFKQLNDSCGHEAGNRCLTQVSALLRSTLRSTDVIARFGGDEFEVLLPDTAARDAATVAEKIRLQIGRLTFPRKHFVTGTAGIAAYPHNAVNAETLFLHADAALYEAKEAGRNRVVISTRAGAAPRALPAHSNGRPAAQTHGGGSQRRKTDRRPNAAPARRSATEHIDGHALVRRLGMGSSGEVLLVKQPELERNVALKRPLTPHLSPEQVQSFEREARITAALEHPGVISIHTMGQDSDGRRYYTMKPLNGRSLAEILQARKSGDLDAQRTFSLGRLLDILQRVAETIAYAHTRNVIHLDLTPANIVVGEFGEVTIIDWGSGASGPLVTSPRVKRVARANGKLSFLAGSAGHAAPEQLAGGTRGGSAASDVHALGSILYEILTGQPPFRRNDTVQTLAAMAKGIADPPEKLVPKAAIDPVLSALCMDALQPHPLQRPAASDFAERLGRFVRRETAFITTRFGPGEQPLIAGDWLQTEGKWILRGHEWISASNSTSRIIYKTPAPGAFRFLAECWIERRAELTLLSHQGFAKSQSNIVLGYPFQFGAEWFTCTKLWGGPAIAGMVPEIGRRYRLELEYNEGWLYCSIDGRRIFEHRELFHKPGTHLGFFTAGPGAHFRPLEIQRQTWGLQVPLLRMADTLFQAEQFQKSFELYHDLAERLPDRLDGLESRLKSGLCLVKLGQLEPARNCFRSLRGTLLEPYALAEEAKLDFRATRDDNRPRGIRLFKALLRRFPESPANAEIVHATFRPIESRIPLERKLRLQIEQERLARDSAPTPTRPQIRAQEMITKYQLRLGDYRHALSEILKFEQRMTAGQVANMPDFKPWKAVAALASGRNELLPRRWIENLAEKQIGHADYWQPALGFEVGLRTGTLKLILKALSRLRLNRPLPRFLAAHTNVLALLAKNQTQPAETLLRKNQFFLRGLAPNSAEFEIIARLVGKILVEWPHRPLLEMLLPRLTASTHPDVPGLAKFFQARAAIETCDFKTGAQILHGVAPGWRAYHWDLLTLQVLLASLGFLSSPGEEDLRKAMHTHLTGVHLDLCRMFLRQKAPVPGKLWPDPNWRPELRLWLALWLEAKGKHRQAAAVAAPARDRRYGLTHSQPALAALLQRCKVISDCGLRISD